jgi:hypothetical protein
MTFVLGLTVTKPVNLARGLGTITRKLMANSVSWVNIVPFSLFVYRNVSYCFSLLVTFSESFCLSSYGVLA